MSRRLKVLIAATLAAAAGGFVGGRVLGSNSTPVTPTTVAIIPSRQLPNRPAPDSYRLPTWSQKWSQNEPQSVKAENADVSVADGGTTYVPPAAPSATTVTPATSSSTSASSSSAGGGDSRDHGISITP